ncbi:MULTISPECIES: hypothetical protein [Cupriavidus]|jgi:hypothetical protein|uniref:Uncharacterized protein n=1 Tax=Cupriavidus metallidurans TaxID=119219 RepID=A0A482ILP8_9BURK|nr:MULTISPECIES: hypothetical protein [Cupriavidus]QBP08876.1 hypothetical protein DDF84_003480 [Cupriavidus metallidurans]QWC89305.1 hypothetical protein KB891_03620 [Cupriavidus metallidurans]
MQSVIVDAVRATMEFPYGADPAASIRRQAIILFWNIAIRRLGGSRCCKVTNFVITNLDDDNFLSLQVRS